MRLLLFNGSAISKLQAARVRLLCLLPCICMFSLMTVTALLCIWFAAYLGIPDGASIKDHPKGTLWLIVFALTVFPSMFIGWLLGWFVNIHWLHYMCDWPWEKAKRVILYSEVPESWIKQNQANRQSTSLHD